MKNWEKFYGGYPNAPVYDSETNHSEGVCAISELHYNAVAAVCGASIQLKGMDHCRNLIIRCL